MASDPDAFAIDFFTDVLILGGVYTATSFIAKHNDNPVYFYEFAYDGNLNHVKKVLCIDREGACHGDELGYLLKIGMLNAPPSVQDEVVRARIVTMWTNFAKYGNPTPEINNLLNVKWKPVTANQINTLVINEKLTMKHDVYPTRTKLFQELYEKYSSSNLS